MANRINQKLYVTFSDPKAQIPRPKYKKINVSHMVENALSITYPNRQFFFIFSCSEKKMHTLIDNSAVSEKLFRA